MTDNAINPNHYANHSVQPIQLIEQLDDYNRSAAIKYTFRAGTKVDQPLERDLNKAIWHLRRALFLAGKSDFNPMDEDKSPEAKLAVAEKNLAKLQEVNRKVLADLEAEVSKAEKLGFEVETFKKLLNRINCAVIPHGLAVRNDAGMASFAAAEKPGEFEKAIQKLVDENASHMHLLAESKRKVTALEDELKRRVPHPPAAPLAPFAEKYPITGPKGTTSTWG